MIYSQIFFVFFSSCVVKKQLNLFGLTPRDDRRINYIGANNRGFYSRQERPLLAKRRRSKDPDQPKRALTAYLFFCKEERRLLSRAELSLPLGDVTKEIAKRWRQIPPERRRHFEQLAAIDKQRYEDEKEAFRRSRDSAANEDSLAMVRGFKKENSDLEDELMITF